MSYDRFLSAASNLLSEAGFELVEVQDGNCVYAIQDDESSVLMEVRGTMLKDGSPTVSISARAVTDVDLESKDDVLKLLVILSGLNGKQAFGAWYFDPETRSIILHHSLLVEGLTDEEFKKIVLLIEGSADFHDDKLTRFLGSGKTAKERLMSNIEASHERGNGDL